MRRALGKKGVEVQFNWIFILIVGGLIIFLVTRMVSFQKESSESLTSSAVRSRVQSILASAISNSDLSSKVNVQAKQMGYDCSGLYIGELGTSRKLSLGTAFAPEEIRSSSGNIVLRSQPWLMPFSAGNFLYITSPEVQYVFLEGSGYKEIADELYSVLPENASKIRIEPGGSLAEVQKSGSYNLRIVLFGKNPLDAGINAILDDKRVSILSVYPADKASFGGYDFNAGTIEFY
ncbi:MAG: hypothetical protein NTV63_00600, partial [Candidatus Woesearchaeota archaeon]|nr:hypothetical protein [Candidatus Woesearchaeota archaeon]